MGRPRSKIYDNMDIARIEHNVDTYNDMYDYISKIHNDKHERYVKQIVTQYCRKHEMKISRIEKGNMTRLKTREKNINYVTSILDMVEKLGMNFKNLEQEYNLTKKDLLKQLRKVMTNEDAENFVAGYEMKMKFNEFNDNKLFKPTVCNQTCAKYVNNRMKMLMSVMYKEALSAHSVDQMRIVDKMIRSAESEITDLINILNKNFVTVNEWEKVEKVVPNAPSVKIGRYKELRYI